MAKIRLRHQECRKGRLPEVCMCCGEPSDLTKNVNFSWVPSWVTALVFVGYLPYLIVALALTKRCTVFVPLCDAHKSHWLWRRLLSLLGTLAVIVLIVGMLVLGAIINSSMEERGQSSPATMLACAFSFLLFFAWLIVLYLVQNSAIRPAEITDRSITLIKVSEDFVRAVEEMDEEEEDDEQDGGRPAGRAPGDAGKHFRPASKPPAKPARPRDDEDDDDDDRGRRRKGDDRGRRRKDDGKGRDRE